MVDVDVCVSSHLKEELAWATDLQLQVISTVMLFKNSFSTKELKGTIEYSHLKFETILFALLCGPLVMYSNCFEIVSTVDFLLARTRGTFMFKSVLLHYKEWLYKVKYLQRLVFRY